MKIWYSVTPSEPFVKENIDEALYLYEQARRYKNQIDGFENKHLVYKMITCPIDIKDRWVVMLWLDYCRSYTADVSLEKPTFYRDRKGGIAQYETYYKQLDLYYQFSHRMQKELDEEWLAEQREKTEMRIMNYLTVENRIISHAANTAAGSCPWAPRSRCATIALGSAEALPFFME